MDLYNHTGNPGRDLFYGIIGTTTPILGMLGSIQEQFEYWLRIISLVCGIAVAIFSLIKLHKSSK